MKISSFDPLFEYPEYNQTGTSAKATAAAKSITDPGAKPSAQSSASPNTSGAKPEVQEPKQPTVAKASELKKDFEFPDEKGNVLKVVSPAGEKTDLPNDMEDIVIAQDARKNIRVFDADADIALPQVNVEESADLGNIFDRKKNLARKLARKGNKLKQLIRAAKFGNDYKEPVFELDFNRKEIIDNALDAPIQCGFEAETTWPNFGSGVEGFDWDYADWDNVEDAAFDQGYSRELSRMKNAYNDWISELAMDYEGEVVARMVDQRKEDEVYLDDFVRSELDSSDIEEYKEELMDDLRELAKQGRMFQGGQDPQAELDEREDWDDDAWGREYAEEYEMSAFEDWLAEQIRDEGEAWEEAFEEAKELNDMDVWVRAEYDGSWAHACSDFDIYMEDENHNDLDQVEESLSSWASAYSKTDEIRQGSYHSGKSIDNTYWRVEDDSSIEGEGSKAEIISPVYDTPREMLTEMKSLFEHFDEEGVETNSTTGLHVTMSFAGDFKETNPLVLATLLGDQYVLKQFDRQFNSYAKSQQQNIQYEIERMLKDGGSPEDFDELYGILSRGIDRGKFSSINFKNATNSDNNQLIEFRIAGGNNYHGNYDKAAKAVIRYAASMSAASEDKPYDRKDFLKTIYRMVNKGASDSLAPTRNDVNISLPDNDFVRAVREILNQTGNRLDAVETLDRAYKELAAGDGVAAKEHFAEFMKSLLVNVRNREKAGGGFKLRPTSLLVRGFKQAMNEFSVSREDIIRAVSQHFVNNADYVVNTTDLDIHDDFIVPTVSILDQILLKKNQPSPQRGPSLGIPHVQDARVYLRRSAYAGQDQYDSNAPVDIDNDVKFVNNDDHFEIDKLISARNVLTSDTLQNNPDPEVKADAQQKLAKVDAELAKFEKIYNVKFANQYPQAGQEMDAFRHANSTDPVWMRHLRSKGIHLYTAESKTFNRFDKLSLQEQLALLAKVDKKKIDEAWSKTNEISDFKKREIEYELRNEPPNNWAVTINGKTWKVVADKRRAMKMVDTLKARGRDANYYETGAPVSEARKKMSAQERMWRRYNNKKINGKTADERAKELEQKIAQMKKARDEHVKANEAKPANTVAKNYVRRGGNAEQFDWIVTLNNGKKRKVSAASRKYIKDRLSTEDLIIGIKSAKKITDEAQEPKDASARAKLDHSLRAQGHKVEKPKKGKGSFKRTEKHRGKALDEISTKYADKFVRTLNRNLKKWLDRSGSPMEIHPLSPSRFDTTKHSHAVLEPDVRGYVYVHGFESLAKAKQFASNRLKKAGVKCKVIPGDQVRPMLKYLSDPGKYGKIIDEADQVKAKERKPKTVKPNTGHQSKHPYRGRLVGESQHLDEDIKDGVLKAFAVAGVILLLGGVAAKSYHQKQEWLAAYEEIKTQDPEKAAELERLMRKYKVAVGNKNLTALAIKHKGEINQIIDDFEKQNELNEGAVPETDFVQEYKQIMSKPLLGSDLKGQMRAFELVPDPAMIREFRNQISQAGRDTDLRTVFKSFASGKLHPVQKKQVGLTESRGVTARDPGEQYISDTDPNDILTINSITVFPPEGDAYESLEELDTALGTALAGEQVVNDNMPNRGTLAAVVATVTDAEGNPQHWIRYLRQIPSAGVHGTWKTLRGYKYSKGAQQESLPLKPTDVLAVDRFMSAGELSKNIVDTVTTNFKGTSNEALIGVMDEAVQKARANDTSPITGAAPYINVLVKYGGEYLGPLALIDGGNTEGDTGKMLESYGLSTLKGSQVLFPGDTAFELVDSLIKTPDGQRIGVSSKAHKGGGAASSLSGIVKQITPEMEAQYPEATAIVRALGTESAIEGPLKVAVMLDLLTETDAEAIRAVGKASKDPGDIKSVKVQQMVAAQGLDDENNPSYRVLFHALAAVVNTLIPMVNAREDFAALLKAALNNNNFIQLMTNGKQTGNDVALNYYTKYPAVFEGAPKLYNKSYFATGQKGRLGFKLKK